MTPTGNTLLHSPLTHGPLFDAHKATKAELVSEIERLRNLVNEERTEKWRTIDQLKNVQRDKAVLEQTLFYLNAAMNAYVSGIIKP